MRKVEHVSPWLPRGLFTYKDEPRSMLSGPCRKGRRNDIGAPRSPPEPPGAKRKPAASEGERSTHRCVSETILRAWSIEGSRLGHGIPTPINAKRPYLLRKTSGSRSPRTRRHGARVPGHAR